MTDTLDDIVDRLYELRPDEFVPARDDAVAAAKADGDKDLAKAIARLRRPSKAAWLANLLARKRGEQLDGLLALGGDLADAQRTLDGPALRALSSQRHRLVAAMAREAGRLAYEAGDNAGESVLREVSGILEAALADPAVADEVRSGQLTRTIAYSGFGPASDPDAVPTRATRPAPREPEPTPATEPEPVDEGKAERERRERELAERRRAVEDAEASESAANAQRDEDDAAREDAESAHADAKEHVADLVRELEAARAQERTTAAAARTAASTAKESLRAASAATARAERARARLAELDQ